MSQVRERAAHMDVPVSLYRDADAMPGVWQQMADLAGGYPKVLRIIGFYRITDDLREIWLRPLPNGEPPPGAEWVKLLLVSEVIE